MSELSVRYYSTFLHRDKTNYCLVNKFIEDELSRINQVLLNSPRKNSSEEIKFHEHLALENTTLEQLKEKQAKIEILVDSFFDTKESTLLKNDCWLRFRNGEWSLKYSVSNENGVLLYCELTENQKILQKLHSVLEISGDLKSDPILYCSHAFAAFRTYRYSFPTLPSFWVDVTLLGSRYYVVTGLDRTVPIQVASNNEFKDCYCLDFPIPSKVIVYMQEKRSERLSYLPDYKKLMEAPNTSFFANNPFGEVVDPETKSIDSVIEVDQEDFANYS